MTRAESLPPPHDSPSRVPASQRAVCACVLFVVETGKKLGVCQELIGRSMCHAS